MLKATQAMNMSSPSKTIVANNEPLSAEAKADQEVKLGARVLAQTRAFGKLILLGEHFVVYKVPALVGAVAAYTDCECELLPDKPGILEIVDNRPAVPNYKTKKQDEMTQALHLVLKHLNINLDQKGLKLTFGGTLCCASGIGASAAQVVALTRALSQQFRLPLSEDEINQSGYEGEKGYHGTPSGIDNTAATFGGVLKFQRTDGEPIFSNVTVQQPIRIVYATTGITSSTTEVVGDVRAKKETDPSWFDALLQKYLDLVPKAEAALASGDVTALGAILNENHALCQELTVSCPELDRLVLAAREAGALGAKMSGTGRGGLMLAIAPSPQVQDAIANALESAGAPIVWKTEFF